MKNPNVPEGYLFNRKYTNYIFALLFLLYMFDYIDRMVITSLFPFLKADWKLTDTQCGLLVSAVYWSIVLFTLSRLDLLPDPVPYENRLVTM